ncbi:MAG: SRPBCC domain-containing protein [Alphaproteobacteria bacterium]|nr:SRPBCC domain-containing protein [Alphaproteobacteria bacterium]
MPDAIASTVTLELTHRFDGSPERVFDAWVTKDWCEWLGPATVSKCEVVTMDPRVGGRYHVRMHMPDRVHDATGEYRELDRPRRLVMTFDGNKAQFGGNFSTLLTITFRPDGKGTLMTLRQEGLQRGEMADGFNQGWAGAGNSFDRLAALLAR